MVAFDLDYPKFIQVQAEVWAKFEEMSLRKP